jgi:hypothetical protein
VGVEEVDELCIFAIDLRKSINFIDVMRNGYGPDLAWLKGRLQVVGSAM